MEQHKRENKEENKEQLLKKTNILKSNFSESYIGQIFSDEEIYQKNKNIIKYNYNIDKGKFIF